VQRLDHGEANLSQGKGPELEASATMALPPLPPDLAQVLALYSFRISNAMAFTRRLQRITPRHMCMKMIDFEFRSKPQPVESTALRF
jgi:hypothetical protein